MTDESTDSEAAEDESSAEDHPDLMRRIEMIEGIMEAPEHFVERLYDHYGKSMVGSAGRAAGVAAGFAVGGPVGGIMGGVVGSVTMVRYSPRMRPLRSVLTHMRIGLETCFLSVESAHVIPEPMRFPVARSRMMMGFRSITMSAHRRARSSRTSKSS